MAYAFNKLSIQSILSVKSPCLEPKMDSKIDSIKPGNPASNCFSTVSRPEYSTYCLLYWRSPVRQLGDERPAEWRDPEPESALTTRTSPKPSLPACSDSRPPDFATGRQMRGRSALKGTRRENARSKTHFPQVYRFRIGPG